MSITPIDYYETTTQTYSGNAYFGTYSAEEIKKSVKKAIKKMMDTMSKDGWIEHADYYFEPKLTPIHLRGVRLDGRGWGNL